jgi:hypothetical protein
MDPTDRIIEEFDRLIALGHEKVFSRPYEEQIVYVVVLARCEADMEGFSSVYEQAFTADEMRILIDGLQRLGEQRLASEFEHGFEALQKDGFWQHRNWNRVSKDTKEVIKQIGKHIDQELWGLDEKLVALLDGGTPGGE